MSLITIRVTKTDADQLLAYVAHRDICGEGPGWYYGNRKHFEQRHASLLDAITRAIVRATSTVNDSPQTWKPMAAFYTPCPIHARDSAVRYYSTYTTSTGDECNCGPVMDEQYQPKVTIKPARKDRPWYRSYERKHN